MRSGGGGGGGVYGSGTINNSLITGNMITSGTVADSTFQTPRGRWEPLFTMLPGEEIPEQHWMYKWAKKYRFSDFGAYRDADLDGVEKAKALALQGAAPRE